MEFRSIKLNIMRSILAVFICLFSIVSSAQNKQVDEGLQQKLEAASKDFQGDVGIYVKHLKSGREVTIHADTVFPTASIVKTPILVKLFDKIDKGELGLNDTLIYTQDRHYGGSGLMQFFKDSTTTDIRTLASLMITQSDNVTSLWSQELAGGGEKINKLMAELGLEHTRVNSRTEGREKIWEKYGWGQTTPREMSQLLIMMRNRELISPAASDEMYRLLSNSFYTDYVLSQIPPFVQTAAKQGMVNRSRSEVVLVNAPSSDYVVYIATKNNNDDSWEYDNEAWKLQREISKIIWQHCEPQSDWTPAKNSEELVRGLRY
jgi:beta-lactamase class A